MSSPVDTVCMFVLSHSNNFLPSMPPPLFYAFLTLCFEPLVSCNLRGLLLSKTFSTLSGRAGGDSWDYIARGRNTCSILPWSRGSTKSIFPHPHSLTKTAGIWLAERRRFSAMNWFICRRLPVPNCRASLLSAILLFPLFDWQSF
jgi:hypothetical protein